MPGPSRAEAIGTTEPTLTRMVQIHSKKPKAPKCVHDVWKNIQAPDRGAILDSEAACICALLRSTVDYLGAFVKTQIADSKTHCLHFVYYWPSALRLLGQDFSEPSFRGLSRFGARPRISCARR